MVNSELSLESGICLSLVALGVDHGYAIARHFEPSQPIGAIYSLSRPAVYRELTSLEDRKLITVSRAVGARGQAMKRLRLSSRGSSAAIHWIESPVRHLRDMRLDFLAKCILREMHGLPLSSFASTQRAHFAELFASLSGDSDQSVTSQWRREQVRAVSRFLDDCEGLNHGPSPIEATEDGLILSARNQLNGTVISVRHGGILSSVKIEIDPGQVLTSTITQEATEQLNLAVGTKATAVFKATDVMMASRRSRPSRRAK